jgi:hypothetical protein
MGNIRSHPNANTGIPQDGGGGGIFDVILGDQSLKKEISVGTTFNPCYCNFR